MMYGPTMGGYGFPWWMIGLLVVIGILILVALGGLVVWLVARNRNPHTAIGAAERDGGRQLDQASALDTLRERYARGEIDSATFTEQVEQLERTRRPDSTATNL